MSQTALINVYKCILAEGTILCAILRAFAWSLILQFQVYKMHFSFCLGFIFGVFVGFYFT